MSGHYIPLCILSLFLWNIADVSSSREDECAEVGFARSSYMTVDNSFQYSKDTLLKQWAEEDEMGSPSFSMVSAQIKNVTRAAILLEETSKGILDTIRKTRVGKRCPQEWLLKGLERHVMPLIQLDKELAESLGLVMSFKCMVGSPFPNVDGTCINEQSPDIGANGAKFLRLLPPVSGKGGFGLRSSVIEAGALPSARKVAQVIRRHLATLPVTSLFVELSHFLAQDTISIPESTQAEDINCCTNSEHPECASINIESDDPIYSRIKCFNIKRSIPAQAILGHRESLTVVSTYFDATPVYGPTNEIAFKLKEGYFGLLKSPAFDSDSHEEPPKTKKKCKFPESLQGCFDVDTKNKNFLENLRLLLILEHNLIAESLAEINPHFDDALLYNEARRILIAEYNAIIYKEFVPLLVGQELAEKHFLLPGSDGPGARYIAEVNPGILTSHAFGSYRNPSMIHEWKAEWGKTDVLMPHQYDSVRQDPYQDLLAIDIQKGRDHGLPGYASWRGFCDSGKQINTWEDMEAIFDKEVVDELRLLYQDEIRDVDMLVALLEKPEAGYAGKIFACILLDQFARLKTGNRLYWEHESALLTEEQRDVIRSQSSAAALLCRHLAIERVPQNPFQLASESNPEVECSTFSPLDMTDWKDTSLIEVMEKKKEEERKQEQEIIDQTLKKKREESKKEAAAKQEKENIEAKRKREKEKETRKVQRKNREKNEL